MLTAILILVIINLVITAFLTVMFFVAGGGVANLGEKVLESSSETKELIEFLDVDIRNRMPVRVYGTDRDPNLTNGPIDDRIPR